MKFKENPWVWFSPGFKKMNKKLIKNIFILFAVTTAFILMSYLTSNYADLLKSYIGKFPTLLAVLVYVFGQIVVTILGPVTLLPILPLVIVLWGPFVSAILTTIGWTIGAMIAFILSKKYGRNLVDRFVDLKQLEWIEKKIPKKNLFAAVIGFRILIPFDFISYALGLFTSMKLLPFTIATLIGTFFSALIVVYAVSLPGWIQFILGVLVVILLVLGYLRSRR